MRINMSPGHTDLYQDMIRRLRAIADRGNAICPPAVLELNACNRACNQWHIRAEALLRMINREFVYP